jgi:drug/metabolite transporter (DMT)-like permease
MPAADRRPSSVGSRLAVLAAAALFSTGGAGIKAVSLGAWQVGCLRASIAALTLFIVLPETRRRPTLRVLGIACCHSATMLLFVLANKLTTAAGAVYLQSTAPLWVLILSPWLLHERIRRTDVVAMLILGAGLASFFIGADAASRTAPNPLLGNVLAVISSLSWALTIMGLRWAGRGAGEGEGVNLGPVSALFGNLLTALICLPMALPLPPLGVRDLGILSYLGVVQVGLAYVCLLRGLRGVPAFEASLLILLEPVLNPIWAWWLHGERPGAGSIAGAALILGATVFKSVFDQRALRAAGVG